MQNFRADRQGDISTANAKTFAAYHEAGHAVATVTGFNQAQLAYRPPTPMIKHIEIVRENDKWTGCCFGPSIYVNKYTEHHVADNWQSAMECQIVVDLAGGMAEAIYRGSKQPGEAFWFAVFSCGMDSDLRNAETVFADLCKVTRRYRGVDSFSVRTMKLLLKRWRSVEALANALLVDEHIWGYDAEKIIATTDK